jgi:hypothetical protein
MPVKGKPIFNYVLCSFASLKDLSGTLLTAVIKFCR